VKRISPGAAVHDSAASSREGDIALATSAVSALGAGAAAAGGVGVTATA